MQKAWDNRDKERGLQGGDFLKKTESTDEVESYGGSALPALMLMFPAHTMKGEWILQDACVIRQKDRAGSDLIRLLSYGNVN